jgi:hypothetical protein
MHIDLNKQFERYLLLVRASNSATSFQRDDLAAEVVERLAQLAFITKNLNEINAQFRTVVMAEVVNENGEKEMYNATQDRDKHLVFVMRMLTESFYYFAFRVRQILRNKVHQFPLLGSFEAAGVRDVRNQLIEHPEGKDSRVFNRTFAWSLESGMHLKSGRQVWESKEFADNGLDANAGEFNENLRVALSRAIQTLEVTCNSVDEPEHRV